MEKFESNQEPKLRTSETGLMFVEYCAGVPVILFEKLTNELNICIPYIDGTAHLIQAGLPTLQ